MTGSIPALPSSLVNGEAMFAECTGLSGSIPPLPKGLVRGQLMFAGGVNLSGTFPELPDSLQDASSMFTSCQNITGVLKKFPANIGMAFETGTNMETTVQSGIAQIFFDTKVTPAPELCIPKHLADIFYTTYPVQPFINYQNYKAELYVEKICQ